MSQQISLYIDVQNRQLVRSNSSTVPTTIPQVFQGDTVGLYLEFLNATGSTTAPYTDIDFSAASVIVAVGTIGAQPAGGDFTITDTAASQTTGNIAYNATASAVQSAIQAALTTHWSTATVTGSAGGPYTITNGANGVETALIGTSINLTPVSSVVIGTIQTGTSDLPQIHYLQLVQNPIALQDSWTAYPAPTATVTRLQGGTSTQNEIQQITLGNNPYDGAFVVNFGSQTSNPIAWNASPATVQTTLQAMSSIGSGNVSVGGSAGAWVVTFTGSKALASQSLMTTVATGLVGPLALTGNLSLNTAAIEEAIGETDSITETFAIQVTPSGGSAFTCLQTDITIYNDLIVGAPSAPTPTVSYYTTTESDARYLILSGSTIASSYLPEATTSVLGAIKVGTGLTATSGVLSVDSQLANFQALGSPGTSGYVLSSTTGGTLSWVAGGGGGGGGGDWPGTTQPLLDSSGNLYAQNGTVIMDSSGELYYPSGAAFTLSGGDVLLYPEGTTLAYSDELLYPDGVTILASGAGGSTLFYPDGSAMANDTGHLYSNLIAGTVLVSGGTGSPTTGVQLGVVLYALASGTNTYTATLSPAPAAYTTGLQVTITFTNANTGASTLNLNSLGAQAIQWNSAALTGGEITAGSTWSLVYDGTQFQIIH